MVAAVENGYCNRGEDITVKMRGGDLIVHAEELERTVDELLVPTTRRVDVPVLLRLT